MVNSSLMFLYPPDPSAACDPSSQGPACFREAAHGSLGAWGHQGKPLTNNDFRGSGGSILEPWKSRVQGALTGCSVPLFGETES